MSENIPTSQGSSKPTKRTDAFLLTLLIASLSLNVYLGWTSVRLKNAFGNRDTSVRLVPGMKIEPLIASDLDGKQQTISYADIGKPTDGIRMLGFRSTPQTIVIAPDGRVLKNWRGVYAQRSQPDVEAFFGVRLPGLTPGSN
jgi:hypothetical protein